MSGQTLDDEFGPGTQDVTHCITRRHNVKVAVQVNQYCASAVSGGVCPRAFALENIENVIADYEITAGMRPGRDYAIIAVVHSGGGPLVIKNGTTGDGVHIVKNEFEAKVMELMAKGVKFQFCQNTTRGMIRNGFLPAGNATAQLLPGVEYTTAGLSSLVDLQSRGYRYIQP